MPQAFTPTPGEYLKLRRRAARLSIDDVAIRTDTTPIAMSVRNRAEWISAIEADIAELNPGTALALNQIYEFDLHVLDELADFSAGKISVVSAICRGCGCSWWDPCSSSDHGECHWLADDDTRCSACFQPDGSPRAATSDDAEAPTPATEAQPAGLTLTYTGLAQAHAA